MFYIDSQIPGQSSAFRRGAESGGQGKWRFYLPQGLGGHSADFPVPPVWLFFFLIKIEVFLVSTAGCGAGK